MPTIHRSAVHREGGAYSLIKLSMICKLVMIPWFIMNFLAAVMLFFGGIVIPITWIGLPILFIADAVMLAVTSLYSTIGINQFYKENQMPARIVFMILQWIFLLDEKYIINRIKELCDKRQMSMYALSKKTGISQSSLSNLMKRGSTPTFYTLDRICDGLGITLSQFFSEVISKFLNRDKEELKFSMFCMVEMDGKTIEAVVDEVSYTFTCSMQGDIIRMGRTDGEKFGLRGK